MTRLFHSSGCDDLHILSLDDIGYHKEIEENGKSFEENSLIKACVPATLGYIGIADDSGLCVDVLDGDPGIYSARYSGEESSDSKNNEKLLRELKEVPYNKRTAYFKCVVSCVFPEKKKEIILPQNVFDMTEKFGSITGELTSFAAIGTCDGMIIQEQRGKSGFGYDPIFYLPEKNKTFAELTTNEKNQISHRGRAMKIFVTALSEILKGL